MTKLTALTEDTAPSGSDLAYTVKDPGGTPLSRKATWTNIVAAGLSAGLTDLGSRWSPASASSAAYLDFREDTDNGTNRVRLIGQTTLAADLTATLPDATGTLAVIDTSAYGAGWNGSTKAPTQDAVYDKVETLAPLTGAWSSYTPTWTASGGNPAIGNGTLAGAYLQMGKTVFFRLNLTFGTTTTSGSGAWEFGLPVSANASAYGVNGAVLFTGYGENSGVAGFSIPGGRMSTAQTKFLIHNGTSGNAWNSTTPFTWGTADFLSLSGMFEAA